MAHTTSTKRPNMVTRCLAAMALISVYCVGIIGASTVMLTATSTSANAQRGRGGGGGGRGGGRGFGRGGGFRGGGYGYRGGGYGRGRGYGFYGGPRIVAPGCYFSRRWGRVVCPY
ncbi:hypothetical protein FNL55_05375 [Tardiphaga sp. vice352]|uniref:hypothetical protein n=1 Tax=unclassified Tardiphaga TaxID=2631404 RepID=UPI001162B8EC|nr:MULTISPECIES: hypothetical protein [unclassified Tardiphaga]QDM15446.1 hypothetical protein FNL53_05445 [Tardiphaga sp. vice278]QDM20488.1 hypothetical protein FIU28_04455 [Tardiphaga sp. vice154]QDM25610.1 hypothetical protein FNL56_05250 [Tardiphaga sp. vice304]QDM30829.1 hypothetical protein FNL55_05375 [Tardiphaga sp. vice352]